MNGSERCLICHELRSDWVQLGTLRGRMLYACEEHRVKGRAQLGNLRRSDSALKNAQRRKRG